MYLYTHATLPAVIAIVLFIGILAQWLAWRTRIPAIVLLTLCGVLAGPVLHILAPAQQLGHALDTVIGLSVAIILFDGGLNLRFHELKHAVSGVRRLVYLGIPLSFALYSITAHYVGGIAWPVALVFGAIIVVTGPTVILPLLRQAMLTRRVSSYLKWEAIINDPIGALLAVLVFDYFLYAAHGQFSGRVVWNLAIAVAVAALLGGAVAYALSFLFRRDQVPEYLKHPLVLVVVVTVFVSANAIQDEAGLLAVTVMGIALGNMRLASIEEMRRFKEYLAVLLVSTVFILLAANLDTSVLRHLRWDGALVILVIMVLARPVAIWIATIGARMRKRERLLLAWIAPRGIVAAATAGVLAPRLAEAGYADAELLVPLTFTLIFVTVLVHGLTLGRLARTLGLAATARNRLLIVGASPWTTEFARTLLAAGGQVLMVDTSWHRLRAPRLTGIPVYYGEILSDSAASSMELHDVGMLLAATSNDAYNALVCSTFATQVGRGQAFQLPMYPADVADAKFFMRGVRGRIAFSEDALYEDLWNRLTQGWTFQKTRLSEGYSYEKYLAECSPESLQLLAVHAGGNLMLHSLNLTYMPKVGDTVLSFGPPRRETVAESSGDLVEEKV
ncbi:MAG: cation:proton antiporter [Gammaproteobacteria bacterium]